MIFLPVVSIHSVGKRIQPNKRYSSKNSFYFVIFQTFVCVRSIEIFFRKIKFLSNKNRLENYHKSRENFESHFEMPISIQNERKLTGTFAIQRFIDWQRAQVRFCSSRNILSLLLWRIFIVFSWIQSYISFDAYQWHFFQHFQNLPAVKK